MIETLADVQRHELLIRTCANDDPKIVEPFRQIVHVTKRTPKLVWIGSARYRISGYPVDRWSSYRIRLPKPGEVEELLAKARAKAEARNETGKEYSRKRERFITIIYQAARNRQRARFEELLAYWEVGNWDEELARIDAANQPKGSDDA